MATPGLVFRIGGVLDPSYGGALVQSVTAAKAATKQIETAQNALRNKLSHPSNQIYAGQQFKILQGAEELERKKTAILINANAERNAIEAKYLAYKARNAESFLSVGQTPFAQSKEGENSREEERLARIAAVREKYLNESVQKGEAIARVKSAAEDAAAARTLANEAAISKGLEKRAIHAAAVADYEARQAAKKAGAEAYAQKISEGRLKNIGNTLALQKIAESEAAAKIVAINAAKEAAIAKGLEKRAVHAEAVADYEIRLAVKKAGAEAYAAKKAADNWKNAQNTMALAAIAKEEEMAVAAQKAEQLAAIAIVARQGGIGAAGGDHGHRYGGKGGVISEIAVIGHEILQGRGTGRILGSISILAGRLGLLSKLVKSTAAAEIELALAENVTAGAMARNVIATQASAVATQADKDQAIADSIAQNIRAKAATEAAEMAAAAATVSLGPIGWAVVAGIALTAVIVGLVFHYSKLAREAKNLADMTNLLSLSFTEQAKVIDEAAKKHQEAIDWEQKHVASINSLKDANDEAVKSLREHAQAEIELARARGAGKQQITAMELAAEREELELLKKQADAMEEKHHLDWLALQDANKKSDAFNFGTGKDSASMLAGAKKRTEENGAIVDAAEAAAEASVAHWRNNLGQAGHERDVARVMTPQGMKEMPLAEAIEYQKNFGVNSFKVGEKPYNTSVAEARANFNQTKSEATRLEALQTEIENAVKSGQTLTGKDLDDYTAKKKERDELASKLGIDEKYKPLIDAAGHKGGNSNGFGLTDRQRAGAQIGGPAVAMLDVAKSTLHEIKELRKDVKTAGGGKPSPWGR